MNVEEAIQHTKGKRGMRVCISCLGLSIGKGARLDPGQRYAIAEHGKHFEQAREAWLSGDLETVAEYFGLYI